jgi:predicted regulator of Ras-like GTPase activity (Roadblock/LC7/MglB family)
VTRNKPAMPDQIIGELERIRRNVPGVRGGITASSDGLLIAHDVDGLEPTQIAALVSAMHAVAARAAASTQCGQFKEVITRGTEGYLAVYAAGSALVAVLGAADLNLAMLNFQARGMIERITEHSGQLARRPLADTAAVPVSRPAAGQEDTGPLPVRRPRGA